MSFGRSFLLCSTILMMFVEFILCNIVGQTALPCLAPAAVWFSSKSIEIGSLHGLLLINTTMVLIKLFPALRPVEDKALPMQERNGD